MKCNIASKYFVFHIRYLTLYKSEEIFKYLPKIIHLMEYNKSGDEK